MSKGILLLGVMVLIVLLSHGTWAEVPGLPVLVPEEGRFRLIVDGAPYLILGGQAHNSTPSDPARLRVFFEGLKSLGGNTAEIPIYWELLEPEPGRYDFTVVDRIVTEARTAGVRVVLLWFATWKNGESHYAPEWVKRDTKTHARVTDAHGKPTNILSPLNEATREADGRAFQAAMGHLREIDGQQHTVILVQVENEPGFLGTDRDYGPEATGLFQGAVPPELTAFLTAHTANLSETMRKAWRSEQTGTWQEAFGPLAEEAFSAWHVARYVDAVARAGKEAYPLPMYANAWLVEPGGERPGKWPSGGPTEHVLDVWKAAAPALDMLSPDIYFPKFHHYLAQYARRDNALFIPEVNSNPFFAAYPFMALVEFNALGFCIFGMDDAATNAGLDDFKVSYGVLSPLLPLISRLQNTGKMHSFVQGIGEGEDWAGTITLAPGLAAVIQYTREFNPLEARGRGLIAETGDSEYLVAGSNFSVLFRALEGPPRDIQILSIDEGAPNAEGGWVSSYRRNGDERSVSLPLEGGIQRVRLRWPE